MRVNTKVAAAALGGYALGRAQWAQVLAVTRRLAMATIGKTPVGKTVTSALGVGQEGVSGVTGAAGGAQQELGKATTGAVSGVTGVARGAQQKLGKVTGAAGKLVGGRGTPSEEAAEPERAEAEQAQAAGSAEPGEAQAPSEDTSEGGQGVAGHNGERRAAGVLGL